ncbi:MAG TPA: TonB-dependent receptor [Pyrinomonadaceae bacterium]
MRGYRLFVRMLSLWLVCSLMFATIPAQESKRAPEASLKVSVIDPNGAAVTAARVRVQTAAGAQQSLTTDGQGGVVFQRLPGEKVLIEVSAEGFETITVENFLLRAGSNQTQVRLEVATVKEEVNVGQDDQERTTDPRGDAFSNVLTAEQIAQLPDDPEEFENALNALAGPGATIRVNGFRGGKLPPKSQIREIRFRRNAYAAENHERGFIAVDIFTKPGINDWHGSLSFGFRDEALSARPAFASRRGPEQLRRYGFTLDGPLWRNHTSLFLNADSTESYDSKTIVAALPGGFFDDLILRPARRLNISARVEHALDKTHSLRLEYQRNAGRQDNLGVGDFDLAERAFTRDQSEHIFRVSESGIFAKRFLNEFRFQARWRTRETLPLSDAPTLLILNAFNRGGAQTSGQHQTRDFELADNFDFSHGQHSMRAGLIFEGGRYDSTETFNPNGTYTFANLEAFRTGRPTTFTQRTGDAALSFSQYQFAWYWQDDYRLRKNLLLSYGLRHELQTNLSDHSNFAPRIGVAWTPNKSGTVTIRAGAGIFYDWFEAGTNEQALRVDGRRQRDLVVLNPAYPDPLGAGTQIVLPPGRIQIDPLLKQPTVMQGSFAVESRLFNRFRLNTDYQFQRGLHLLRARNLNAPVPGLGRPDPAAGNITQVESSATSTSHRLTVHFAPSTFTSNIFWSTFYSYSRNISDTNGALNLPADNFNLRAERGPAPNDMRHFFTAMINRKLFKGFSLGATFNANSALPYNITTGFDDNGDTVSNDRPAGVGRNSARGKARWDVNTRLGWSFGFGGVREASASSGPVMIRMGGEGGVPSLPGASNQRFRMEFYAQAFNLFNHTNLSSFTGVQTSPFYGLPTAALPGRRMEFGTKFNF